METQIHGGTCNNVAACYCFEKNKNAANKKTNANERRKMSLKCFA